MPVNIYAKFIHNEIYAMHYNSTYHRDKKFLLNSIHTKS